LSIASGWKNGKGAMKWEQGDASGVGDQEIRVKLPSRRSSDMKSVKEKL